MEKTVKSGELVKNKSSRKMLVGQITILTVIFTVGMDNLLAGFNSIKAQSIKFNHYKQKLPNLQT